MKSFTVLLDNYLHVSFSFSVRVGSNDMLLLVVILQLISNLHLHRLTGIFLVSFPLKARTFFIFFIGLNLK